jgi:5-methylcytosine-specific restriction endonuclease McrA
MLALNQCTALVLNADYRPLSYGQLSVWSWEKAVHAVFKDRVDVVAEHERAVHSPSRTLRLPSVIVHRHYQDLNRPAAFTRANVLLRDRKRCLYCTSPLTGETLTFDHVLPQSRKGQTNYLNCVSACVACNLRKANKTPREAGMRLLEEPTVPTIAQLNTIARRYPVRTHHEAWLDYLDCKTAELIPTRIETSSESEVFPKGMTSDAYWHVQIES